MVPELPAFQVHQYNQNHPEKKNNKQVSLSLLCLRFIAIFCYLGQQSAPSTQSTVLFLLKNGKRFRVDLP